jgi:hypothetical protein
MLVSGINIVGEALSVENAHDPALGTEIQNNNSRATCWHNNEKRKFRLIFHKISSVYKVIS